MKVEICGHANLIFVDGRALTFADVVSLTGLTSAEVADMVYDVMETEVKR